MSALDELFEELVSLYGFACQFDVANNYWKSFLEQQINSPSETTSQSLMYFGRQDPNDFDATHQYKLPIRDLISNSQKDGPNQHKARRMLVVFTYALWEDNYRSKVACECSLENKNCVKSDLFQDLNKYRQAILHVSGRLDKDTKVLNFFKKGDVIDLSEAQFYDLYRILTNELNQLSLEYYKSNGSFDMDKTFSQNG